jgi:ABC-type methionine transport system ATPase subunit
MRMAKRAVVLTFPQELIKEPVLFQMARDYDIMPNIRRAKVDKTRGEVVLELEGEEENLEKGLDYLSRKGVKVEPVIGDIVE